VLPSLVRARDGLEPLPQDSPLWAHPRILVTPHVASLTDPETSCAQIADNIRRLYADTENFLKRGNTGFAALIGEDWDMIPPELDPPVHHSFRSQLAPIYSPSRMMGLQASIAHRANEIIDRFRTRGECEFVRDFAVTFPVSIFLDLIGLPQDRLHELVKWVKDLIHGDQHDLRVASVFAIKELLIETVAERRRNPGDDLISTLATLSDESEPLTNDEIVSNVILLFAAGHETTSNMIGNALVSLHRNPAQLEKLKNNPSLMPKAVAECIRYDGSVQMVTRVVSEDVEIAGVKLARDTALFASIGAANRDPARFDDPDTLDIERDDHGRLLSFGGGIHYCLGARLALLELETSLAALFERAPNLRLRNLDDLHWNNGSSIRGVQSLVASRE